MLAQVQTNSPLHFNKPFVLVTRVGNNEGNDTYHNPTQRYYEYDSMRLLFKAAALMHDEKPVSALRIVDDLGNALAIHVGDADSRTPTRADYFHNFPAALDEYKRGIRVDM